jgi:hypothetical protein
MLGTALSLIFCTESFFLFVVPASVGWLHRLPGGYEKDRETERQGELAKHFLSRYENGIVLLLVLSLAAVACAISLFFVPQAKTLLSPSGFSATNHERSELDEGTTGLVQNVDSSTELLDVESKKM